MFSGPGTSKPTSVVPKFGDDDGPATDEGELEEEQGHVSDDDPISEEDHLGHPVADSTSPQSPGRAGHE